jgi:hypothetical protein
MVQLVEVRKVDSSHVSIPAETTRTHSLQPGSSLMMLMLEDIICMTSELCGLPAGP